MVDYVSNQAPSSEGLPLALPSDKSEFVPDIDSLNLETAAISNLVIENSNFPKEFTVLFTLQASADNERFFSCYNAPYLAIINGDMWLKSIATDIDLVMSASLNTWITIYLYIKDDGTTTNYTASLIQEEFTATKEGTVNMRVDIVETTIFVVHSSRAIISRALLFVGQVPLNQVVKYGEASMPVWCESAYFIYIPPYSDQTIGFCARIYLIRLP